MIKQITIVLALALTLNCIPAFALVDAEDLENHLKSKLGLAEINVTAWKRIKATEFETCNGGPLKIRDRKTRDARELSSDLLMADFKFNENGKESPTTLIVYEPLLKHASLASMFTRDNVVWKMVSNVSRETQEYTIDVEPHPLATRPDRRFGPDAKFTMTLNTLARTRARNGNYRLLSFITTRYRTPGHPFDGHTCKQIVTSEVEPR